MSVKHSVLALLSEEPATASHIKARFAETFDNLWPLNMGQVAQTLGRLERDGLIATDGELTGPTGRRATSYAITPAGRKELSQWWMSTLHNDAIERYLDLNTLGQIPEFEEHQRRKKKKSKWGRRAVE